MRVHLVDGTYELFRSWFGAPEFRTQDGREVGATLGFIRTLVALVRDEKVTHIACAFDSSVESFRNELFTDYKTGEGLEPELFAQFPLVEQASRALGFVTWPMVEFEADDALATGAARYAGAPQVEQIVICSPDKDLAQCVIGDEVITYDRRKGIRLDVEGVREKFGVQPESIPDYLGLVGDSADGIHGIPRWGAKSTAAVLAIYPHLEDIPKKLEQWTVKPRGAAKLCENLAEHYQDALLFRKLALLRRDVPLEESLEDLQWRGVDEDALGELAAVLERPNLVERVRETLS